MAVEIREVGSRSDLAAFVDLAPRLHAADPHFICPLRSDVLWLFDERRNPFFRYASVRSFLAWRGGRAVGRISAIWNPRFNAHAGESAGWFGWFESEDEAETAAALLDAAAAWCRRRGARVLYGPASFTMNDECGLLVEGFDADPVFLMPHNPAHYPRLVEQAGLRKRVDLLSWRREAATDLDPGLQELAERARARSGVSSRGFEMRHLERDLVMTQQVFNEAWEENWGSVPLTDEEIVSFGARLRPVAAPELLRLAFVDGEPAAVHLTFPDFNQVLKHLGGRLGPLGLLRFLYWKRRIKGCHTLIFGVRRRFRLRGLDALLWVETERICRRRGYSWAELGWTLETNEAINALCARAARRSRRYRIYERPL